MCGIAGVVGAERAAPVSGVGPMVQRLAHRGPDATGERSFNGCSLGHTRLRIIDLSPLGDQPMSNEDGTVWAAFNGEIYNFGALRSQLRAAGHRFRSATDTEVLVHLYEEHGDEMARHLHGMFAFAVWDDRRRRLVLCRDRLGIKPLYYRAGSGSLAFASEVQALSEPSDPIDPVALRDLLRLGWVAGPRTIRAGIAELPPGHLLTWHDGVSHVSRFWSPPAPAAGALPPAREELGAALDEAIRRHLVADVPVGLFLSAGVDSVAVARLASRVAPGLQTYTVAFESGADESGEAGEIAARLDLEHTVVPVGHAEALAAVGRFVADMDQPTVDGLNSWIISRAVRDAGLVVALSGLGGDELFCGYSTFRHVPRLVAASRALQPLGAGRRALVAAMDRSGRTAHSRARRALDGMAGGGWGSAYASVRGLFSETELSHLWPAAPAFGHPPVEEPDHGDEPAPATVGGMEMANYLPFQLLRDTDCMSMAHALEVRVPLLDDAVVELAVRGQHAAGGGWNKGRLMDAVDPGLRYLVERPKRTFTLPIADWMRGGLRDPVEGALVGVGESDFGFNRRALTDLWHGYLAGRVGWRPVWGLAVLGMWLDTHAGAGRVTTAGAQRS
jgi:asparagine synthase (glutamine-hydrolysing)